jgi:peptidyl-prolyl cis-trans isomerase B (cyclophilin B)
MRGLAAVALVLVLGAAACGGSDDESGATTTTAPATTGKTADDCRQVEQPAAREPGSREAPDDALDPGGTYKVVMETSCGPFTITLDQKTSPQAAASFVSLARDGYFDGTAFHRIVPGFVIQGGDPSGTGSGGPGYSTVDPPPAATSYTLGTVAMAKAETEPPGTAGSQFFVMTADAPTLPPDYAVIGHVTDGLPVVRRIGRLGNTLQQPTQPVVIEHAQVEEG